MPQIANQDFLMVDIQNNFFDVLSQEKATELAQRGVIFDVIIKRKPSGATQTAYGRIIGYSVDDEGIVKTLTFQYLDSTEFIEYD